jgi:hypothetical protein
MREICRASQEFGSHSKEEELTGLHRNFKKIPIGEERFNGYTG